MKTGLTLAGFLAITHLEGVSATTASCFSTPGRFKPNCNSRELRLPVFGRPARVAPSSPVVREKTMPHVQISAVNCGLFSSCFSLPPKRKKRRPQLVHPSKLLRTANSHDEPPESHTMSTREYLNARRNTYRTSTESEVSDDDLPKSITESDKDLQELEASQEQVKEIEKKELGRLKLFKSNVRKMLKHILTP